MKAFTTFKFFAVNKRKGLMTFLVIILTVCAVSLITGLIGSIFDITNQIDLKMFENFSMVYSPSTLSGLPQDTVDKLKADTDIAKLLPVSDLDFTDITLAIGGSDSIPIVVAPRDSIQELMRVSDDTVKQGRLPNSGADEIAVHWKVMNNKGWKIGQTVGGEVDPDEVLSGKYKIVGVLDGPTVIGYSGNSVTITNLKKAGLYSDSKPLSYAILPKDGKRDAVNKTIAGFDKKKVGSYTYDSMKRMIDQSIGSLSTLLTLIIFIVVFILSISTAALMYLIYTQRNEEFGILAAMGYRRSFTRKLILKEVASLNVISWVIGTLLSIAMIALMNRFIYMPKGTPLTLYSLSVFYNTLIIPVMVAVFSLLPILLRLRRQDSITIIERRD